MRAIHHILMLMTGRSLDFFIPEWAKRNRNDYYGENLMKLQIPETMDTVGLLRFASCLISFMVVVFLLRPPCSNCKHSDLKRCLWILRQDMDHLNFICACSESRHVMRSQCRTNVSTTCFPIAGFVGAASLTFVTGSGIAFAVQ